MVTAREAIADLIYARGEIERWDRDFTPPPYYAFKDASDALLALDAAERDRVLELLDEPRFRRDAAYACGVLKLARAHDVLVAGLRDGDQDIRDECARALLAISPTTTLQEIAKAGTAIDDKTVDKAAVAAIDTLGVGVVSLLEQVGYTPSSSVLGGTNVWWRLHDLFRDAVNHALERGVRGATFHWVYGTQTLLRQKQCRDAWIRPTFTALATHSDVRVARMAAEVLAELDRISDA